MLYKWLMPLYFNERVKIIQQPNRLYLYYYNVLRINIYLDVSSIHRTYF